MEFRILGPLEVAADTGRLELGGTRQQVVVATLLLSSNRVVTMDRLLEAIYGEDLPPTARSQAQISISSLRRLFASHSRQPVISTHPHGYAIEVSDERVDSQQFDKLVASARAARDAKRPGEAVACYRDALRLWRGPALDGIESQLVRVAASRMDEQRIATLEDRIDLELDLGRHHELVGELTELVDQHPLREQLRGQLMLALYRCDRTAEALQAYRQARRTLIDELGIEPGDRLQQLEHAILNADTAIDLPAEPVRIQPVQQQVQQVQQVPSLLPIDIADFTGRAKQMHRIRRHLLPEAGPGDGRAVPVVVVVGKGGVGKTTVAVHASHDLASDFPDGQLFADLHGNTSHPVGPIQVLERFLRALGVTTSFMPEGLDERAEMYRSMLASRKILVVLDDAMTESQVAPLLPGRGDAAVLVTSRRRLSGLAGAEHVELNVFEAARSLDLLSRIAGDGRVQAESRAAAEVAALCGYLPLALRIAGARLSARPHWTVQQLVDRLADETRRLDELMHGDMGIRPSISLTYESISEPAKRLFRRLALLDLPVFSGWMSAALLDMPLADAEDLLDDLINAQLIDPMDTGSGVRSHYRFHDLIRVFAREQLVSEEPAHERRAALERAFGALLYLAEEAHCRHYGGRYFMLRNDARRWPLPARLVDELLKDPLDWYDHERGVLVAAVRQAAQAALVEQCWGLAVSAVTLFESRVYLGDWQETHDIALDAARRAEHVRGQAAMLYSIGTLNIAQQRFDQAGEVFAEAAALFADADDDQGTALVLRYMAFIEWLSGRLDEAAMRYEQALAIFERTGDKAAAAYVLNGLAQVKLDQREVVIAKELLGDALRLAQAARCRRIEAQVLYRTGEANLLGEDLAEAIGAFELALARCSEIRDPIGEAYTLIGSGVAKVRQHEYAPARDALERALELAAAAGQPMTEARALLGLSELALTSGDPAEALVYGRQASDIFGRLGALLDNARALILLSHAHAAAGDADAAQAAANEAACLKRKQAHSAKVS